MPCLVSYTNSQGLAGYN